MKNMEEKSTEIAIIDERSIRDKIYEVRGVKVMLDFDLAEIYGYETKAFNQQVKRNEDRFPSDFRFRLTREEIEKLIVTNPEKFSSDFIKIYPKIANRLT